MIKVVTVTNYLGESLRMDLAEPEKSGLAITSITGLGPGKANINVSDYSINDGGIYSSARMPSRNIVISFMYLWKNTIEDSRHLTYRYFPLKRYVTLDIETDTRKVSISGYVESNEPDIFNSDSGGQISIICPDPRFYASTDNGFNTFVFENPEKVFKFPFTNPVNNRTLLLSRIVTKNRRWVYYSGDAESGLIIKFRNTSMDHTASNLSFTDFTTGDNNVAIYLDDVVLNPEETIIINTTKGNKSVYRLDKYGDISENLINHLNKSSKWVTIKPGYNDFAYGLNNDNEENKDTVEVSIQYRMVYEGV